MSINLDDARTAVKRGTRSASHAIDGAHDASIRALHRAHDVADDVIDASDSAAHYTSRYAKSAHDWMEEKPHLAALAALAAGVILGVFLSPRR
jgi:ElaB/YqjD/DUF883 family membrane-anchored ribosome-binding protein